MIFLTRVNLAIRKLNDYTKIQLLKIQELL